LRDRRLVYALVASDLTVIALGLFFTIYAYELHGFLSTRVLAPASFGVVASEWSSALEHAGVIRMFENASPDQALLGLMEYLVREHYSYADVPEAGVPTPFGLVRFGSVMETPREFLATRSGTCKEYSLFAYTVLSHVLPSCYRVYVVAVGWGSGGHAYLAIINTCGGSPRYLIYDPTNTMINYNKLFVECCGFYFTPLDISRDTWIFLESRGYRLVWSAGRRVTWLSDPRAVADYAESFSGHVTYACVCGRGVYREHSGGDALAWLARQLSILAHR